jgi:DNA repair protein RecN (Recombination protein N)
VVSEATNKSRSRLEEISIRGLGVIDSATIEFTPGLNVITGETGAGKTMVITALSLVLGGKADSDLIRRGNDRLFASGRFTLPKKLPSGLEKIIEEQELEIEESEILLARTVNQEGKSRAQLQGLPTTAAILSNFSNELIEIHGQHGTLQLSKPAKQRELLDAFGGSQIQQALGKYQELLAAYNEIRNRIREIQKAAKDRDQELEELAALVSDYAKLKPKRAELANIEIEISRLESVEEIRQFITGAVGALDAEESGSLTSLNQVRRLIASAGRKDPKIEALNARIDEAFYSLSDISSELSTYLDALSADPVRLEELISRRVGLKNFAKRYGVGSDLNESLDVAIERAEQAEERMLDLQGGEDRIASLRKDEQEILKQLITASTSLSKLRAQFAASLDSKVTKELQALAMPKANFKCAVTPTENLLEEGEFGAFGNDEIEMLFAAHAGGELLPISKAASGGELSRLMLALEVVVAETSPKGTYLFDEVDAGIGGKAALEVGKRLKKLAEFAQIIVVTHLPQVAIWADNHLRVFKDSTGSITESSISKVESTEREIEIARMLSGLEESEHAQEHARELLDLVKG